MKFLKGIALAAAAAALMAQPAMAAGGATLGRALAPSTSKPSKSVSPFMLAALLGTVTVSAVAIGGGFKGSKAAARRPSQSP